MTHLQAQGFKPTHSLLEACLNRDGFSFVWDPTTLSNSRLKSAWTIDTATPESRQKAVAQNRWAHDAVQCMSENNFTENWLLAGCSGCHKNV